MVIKTRLLYINSIKKSSIEFDKGENCYGTGVFCGIGHRNRFRRMGGDRPGIPVEKHHGKQLWGVRLFDSAEPAQERRMYRTGRRLNERRRRRLKWLQEIFSDEIGKVDPAFFQRLKESRFLEVDKEGTFERKRYCLFGDPAYTDKQYHQQYPTIYL